MIGGNPVSKLWWGILQFYRSNGTDPMIGLWTLKMMQEIKPQQFTTQFQHLELQ